ncbi:MAG TPA: pilin [Candidatus Portnoybacteria bacterium]|jgi:fumarate reductase subunit D|nr:pilin [Candidatus Portnoybacteria bacterium]MDD5752257.1 pilin [Candidatus Portnoybacteria bacterium]HNU96832.1 pilin [Candidatus Portnoybacteria bacterium]HOZ16538.1 pilin [Candidatus Portnoybacteria bacterium]HPH52297.1 pilin [Candidatus Portnoybacteria bacterium]
MEKTLFFVGILSIMILVPFIVDAVTLDNPLKCSSDDNCLLEIIQKITELLQIIAIAVGVVMIIIAGIQYMTSAGSEDKTKKAKQMIVYTLIGVAIITAANFIIGLIQEILGKINN